MTRKKKQQISKSVHYIFAFKHKMSKQDKPFIFMKNIYDFVLIFIVYYIYANKDLFVKKKIATAIVKSQRRRHYSIKIIHTLQYENINAK